MHRLKRIITHHKTSKTPHPPQDIPYRHRPRNQSLRTASNHNVRIVRQPNNDGSDDSIKVLQGKVGHGIDGVHEAGDWAQGYGAEFVVDAEAGVDAGRDAAAEGGGRVGDEGVETT